MSLIFPLWFILKTNHNGKNGGLNGIQAGMYIQVGKPWLMAGSYSHRWWLTWWLPIDFHILKRVRSYGMIDVDCDVFKCGTPKSNDKKHKLKTSWFNSTWVLTISDKTRYHRNEQCPRMTPPGSLAWWWSQILGQECQGMGQIFFRKSCKPRSLVDFQYAITYIIYIYTDIYIHTYLYIYR